MKLARFALFVLPIVAMTTPALADDWIATRLYGPVEQQVGEHWVALGKGDSVLDGHTVRTLAGGRVTLVRGTETIDLGALTQIAIQDNSGSKPFTTVTQSAGRVSVEADIRNVQHFAVVTPMLAAVVKGTRFVVSVTRGNSSVSVRRGHVEVESFKDKTTTLLSVGQEAEVGPDTGGSIVVSGSGELPVVYAANGKALGVLEKGAKGNAFGIAKQAATPGNGAPTGSFMKGGEGNGNRSAGDASHGNAEHGKSAR
jgi:hypothetical protein